MTTIIIITSNQQASIIQTQECQFPKKKKKTQESPLSPFYDDIMM